MTLTQGVKRKVIRSKNTIRPTVKRHKVKHGAYLKQVIEAATDCIAPSWGLTTFIARNPLKGLTHLPFETALQHYYSSKFETSSRRVNSQVAKWCHAYFDLGESSIPIPDKQLGFYRSWKSLAKYDREINGNQEFLRSLSENPEQVIRHCLLKLQIEEVEWEKFFRSELLQLKGWASYIKENGSLIEYLAVRLAILCILTKKSPLKLRSSESKQQFKLSKVQAKEKLYEEKLLKKITSTIRRKQTASHEVQLVFCIDTRSESIRRRIEESGLYQTFGCAGFFGLPLGINHQSRDKLISSCPVIVNPEHTIKATKKVSLLNSFKKVYADLKSQFGSSFGLVESMGAFCAPAMMWKTFSPLLKIKKQAEKKVKYDFSSIPFVKQAEYAEKFLKSIGLVSNFSKWVVICGHGSTTTNNLYASSLDCGACGGNHGGPNAQVMAAILNRPEVRLEISKKGIMIPLETRFISAEHDTTTDYIHFFEKTKEDETLRRLKCKLAQVGQANTRSRLSVSSHTVGEQNAQDWSAVRPEWGLAKNASFIVASRAMTSGIDLESRAFLHSYEWKMDEDGSILESILLGPVVVAHWINAQYFFSTLDHFQFGAGSKIFHNLTGKLGVVKGNGGDLMEGLPLESVNISKDEAFHEPLRLLVIINAPLSRVRSLIDKHKILKELVENQWVFLKIIDPLTQKIHKL